MPGVHPPEPDLDPSELEFRFLGGRPSLDLCATVGERWRRSFERLGTPRDLDRWVAESGLTTVALRATSADLAAARELRESIYEAAEGAIAGKAVSSPVARTLSVFAAPSPLRPRLHRDALTWDAPEGITSVLSTVAADAIDLLHGPLRSRIRECAASTCALLFVDASRPGRRRWCSSTTCGGRARAQNYRQRHAARPPNG